MTVNTNNGISGNGSIVTPVILGGKPLTAVTVIDLGGFSLELMENIDPSHHCAYIFQSSSIDLQIIDTIAQVSSEYNQTHNGFEIFGTNLATGAVGTVSAVFDGVVLTYITDGGGGKAVHLDEATGLLVVDNADHIGLVGTADFSTNAILDNNAYAQVAAVKKIAPVIVAADAQAGNVNTSTTIVSFVPGTDGIFRFSATGMYRSGTGHVNINAEYFDLNGDPIQVSFGTDLSSVNPSPTYPSLVAHCQAGGAIVIQFDFTGTITYDAGGVLERLLDS